MNHSEPVEVVNAVCEEYVVRLASEIGRLGSSSGGKIYAEAALRRSDGKLATEGESGLGTRVDVVVPSTAEFLSVDTPSRLSFQPFRICRGTTEFTVAPFAWDSCVVTLTCVPEAFAWQPILDWFHRWFDADDARLPDERGLCGVVHFLDEPHLSESGVSLVADLGSAPVEAFFELLDACDFSQPKSATVGTRIGEFVSRKGKTA